MATSRLPRKRKGNERHREKDIMDTTMTRCVAWGWVMLTFVLTTGAPVFAGADQAEAPVSTQSPSEEIQERGGTPGLFGDVRKDLHRKPLAPGPASPPPQLCHTETHMMTQCKCFNQPDCQSLTALFPNSCPAGSSHCEFIPMSRGPMPALPPNLCSYQVPFPVTRCACHTQAECQLLSPFCPAACPAGSQSCECTPMQRR